MKATIRRTLALLFLLGTLRAAYAQDSGIGAEHRYQFVLESAVSTLNEKLMTESISSLDPEMRINIDRTSRLVKVLAYRPLSTSEIVNMAALHGITLRALPVRYSDLPKADNEQ
ncbi:MAG: hypothetical protein JNL52_09375 [Flavobacteriales bacterium]|nr:hypothetical protein [Flavobacteriales bacterium]